MPLAEEYINLIRDSKSLNIEETKENSNQVRVYQNYRFNIEEFNRIVAKMAFNCLVLAKGHKFVLNSKFDLIRSWIYRGNEENNFVGMIERDRDLEKRVIPYLPDRAHYIIIMQNGPALFAFVSFYGDTYSYIVKLAELELNEILILSPIGFICDWKNRKEYTLSEHLLNVTKGK